MNRIWILILVVFLVSCKNNTVSLADYIRNLTSERPVSVSEKMLNTQEELELGLSELGKKAYKLNVTLDETQYRFTSNYENIKKDLKKKPKKVLEVTESLHSDNGAIALEVVNLEKDFRDIQNKSEIYFNYAYMLLAELNDNPNFSEFKKDVELRKESYSRELKNASEAIEDVKQAVRDIDDIEKILALYSSLGEIDKQIDKLRQITSRAQSLAKEIQDFSTVGKEIIVNPN